MFTGDMGWGSSLRVYSALTTDLLNISVQNSRIITKDYGTLTLCHTYVRQLLFSHLSDEEAEIQ